MDILLLILQSVPSDTPFNQPIEQWLVEALWAILLLITNGFAFMLYQRIKKLEDNIDQLQDEIMLIKTNYLNRFQDIKDHVTNMQLQIVKEITTLATKLDLH